MIRRAHLGDIIDEGVFERLTLEEIFEVFAL